MPLDFKQLEARIAERPPVSLRWFDMRLLSVTPELGKVVTEFLPHEQFCSPSGTVQGGFVSVMLDDLCALSAIISAQSAIVVPTIDFTVRFFRPVLPSEPLTGHSVCKKLGKKIAFLEASLFDSSGNLLAAMAATGMPGPIPTAGETR